MKSFLMTANSTIIALRVPLIARFSDARPARRCNRFATICAMIAKELPVRPPTKPPITDGFKDDHQISGGADADGAAERGSSSQHKPDQVHHGSGIPSFRVKRKPQSRWARIRFELGAWQKLGKKVAFWCEKMRVVARQAFWSIRLSMLY
jgi:hypothetical protein